MASSPAKRLLSHSRCLFRGDDGASLRFYLRPCASKRKLKEDIEHGGGILTSRIESDVIKLVPVGDVEGDYGEDFHSAAFIVDCVTANELLALDAYR
ncbi:telomeric repeat-binding factor 2-interacting protein 1-like [Lampetra fluviatilis]